MADIPDAEADADLAELRRLAGRAGIDPRHPVTPLDAPPAALWDRIEAEAEARPGSDELSRRRAGHAGGARPRWVLPATAAAAVAVVAAVGVVVATGGDDGPEVLAAAELEVLGDAGAGSAELIDDGGTLRLRVATEGIDPGDGAFLEVWVIDPAVSRLVSLGPVRADGTYDLPPGLDPAAFPIVDVSVEPIDGDPTHSGASVLRGQLPIS